MCFFKRKLMHSRIIYRNFTFSVPFSSLFLFGNGNDVLNSPILIILCSNYSLQIIYDYFTILNWIKIEFFVNLKKLVFFELFWKFKAFFEFGAFWNSELLKNLGQKLKLIWIRAFFDIKFWAFLIFKPIQNSKLLKFRDFLSFLNF